MRVNLDFRTDPIDAVRWVPASTVHPNPWNPNRVHTPELTLLETSILLTGWVQPVLVRADDQMIIDGFHRWRLAQDSQPIVDRYDGHLPIVRLDLSREDAMLLTVRINRAKGSHASVLMSRLVRELIAAGVDRDRIAREMGATDLEVDLLAAEDVFVARGSAEWAYGPSWYPVEDGRTAAQSRGLEEPRGIPAAVQGDEP